MVLAAGLPCWLCGLHELFCEDVVEWTPNWHRADLSALNRNLALFASQLDILLAGCIAVGLPFVARDLWAHHQAGNNQPIFMIGATLAANGARYNRILAIGGMCYASLAVHNNVQQKARIAVQKWGEVILEVATPEPTAEN